MIRPAFICHLGASNIGSNMCPSRREQTFKGDAHGISYLPACRPNGTNPLCGRRSSPATVLSRRCSRQPSGNPLHRILHSCCHHLQVSHRCSLQPTPRMGGASAIYESPWIQLSISFTPLGSCDIPPQHSRDSDRSWRSPPSCAS